MKKRLGMLFGVLCLSMMMTTQVFATELSDETQDQIIQEVVTELKGTTPSFDNLSPGVNTVTVEGVTKKVLADENGVLIQKPAATWYQYNNYQYYYEEDNYLAYSKVLTIGGNSYYFGPEARMCTGPFQVYDVTMGKSVFRLADANGVIVTTPGWYNHVDEDYVYHSGWYYIQEDGTLLAGGIYDILGTEYGFTYNGRLAVGGCTYYENGKSVCYLMDENGVVIRENGWHQIDTGNGNAWYYVQADGTALTNGIHTVNGKKYFFSDEGKMATGSFWMYDYNLEKSVYRLAKEDGELITTQGWYQLSNGYEDSWYYVQSDETLLTNGVHTVNGKKYYFLGNGEMATGFVGDYNSDLNKYEIRYAKEDGELITTQGWYQLSNGYEDLWYYVQGDGTLLTNGIHTVNGKKYFFYFDGEMATGSFAIYDADLQKSVYRLAKEDGELITAQGWYQYVDSNDNYNESWYYIKSDGTLLTNGIHTINGKKYYFNESGRLCIGIIPTYNSSTADWEVRITKPDGELVMNGWYYFVDSDFIYNNGWYYVKDGIVLCDGIYTIDGKDYCFSYSGLLRIGNFLYNDEYFITDENGAVIKTPGWHQVDGNWYYIQLDGNLIQEGIYTIAGKRYAFSERIMQKGSAYVYDSNMEKFIGVLTDENGVILEKEAGWYQRDAKWYYFKEKGIIAAKELLSINGNNYYFDYDGEMAVGYVYHNWVTRYVANSQGVIAQNGWVQYGPDWYYAKDDGKLVVEDWVEIGGNSYYMDTAGAMVTGYYRIDNSLYRFADSGAKIANLGDFVGWKQVDGIWYYFKEKGVSYDGWVDNTYYIEDSVMCYQTAHYENDKYYYLDKNGKKVIGWYQNEDDWYYGKADGVLAYSEWLKIDGTLYYFSGIAMVTNLAETFNKETGAYELHQFAKDGAWLEQITGKNKWVQGTFRNSYMENESWIYIDKNGNWYHHGEVEINGVKYYFDGGVLCTDKVVSIGDKWVYVNKNGLEQKLSAGWHQIQDSWYYVKSNGEFAEGLQTINGKQYFFLDEYYVSFEVGPVMVTGTFWVDELDKECFFGNDGAMITPTTGWYQVGKAWYYFKNGIPARGFQTINGATYYFENGYMCTGCTYVESAEAMYVFDTSGKLVKNQWVYANEEWYYADAKGRALTGEHVIGGKKYIFKANGVMI